MKFKITTARENNDCLIYVAGSLDNLTCPVAEEKINNALAKQNSELENVILDFKDLLYISSLGLRILFKLAKQYPSRVKIINVPDEVMDIFKMIGIDKTMSVTQTNL